MKKLIPVICIVFISLSLHAQEVLLEQEVSRDTAVSSKGPNRSRFMHFYAGYGFTADEGEAGARVKPIQSHEFALGFRQKFKLGNLFSAGYDITYANKTYRLKQDASKVLPNNITHIKETIKLNTLGAGIFFRTNFKKNRGNVIGDFFDIGFNGEWIYKATHNFTDGWNAASYNAGRADITLSDLKYVESIAYGPIVRLGFNRYVLFGQYRMSDIFKSSYNYPELPRITAGLQISMH